jgi:hypothetical protein
VSTRNPILGYYKEGANKAAPAFANTNGSTKLRLLRLVSEDLNSNLRREESNEVRGDAQSSGSVIVGANGTGSIQLQYSLDTYDDLLVGLLYAADVGDAGTLREDGWQQGGFTPLADVMAAAASVTFQVADGSFNGTFARAPAAGERIYVTGFGNKNLDTIWVVAAGATTSKVIVENDTGMASVATYAGVAADVVAANVLIRPVKGYTRNGTLERKFGLVRMYTDTSLAGTNSTSGLNAVDWALFRGAVPTSIQLAVAPGQAGWTGTMSFLFSDESIVTDASSNANIGGFDVDNWDEVLPPNTNPLVNAIQSVVMVRLRKNSGAITTATRCDPLSFNFSVANNAQEIEATRNLGAIEINLGTFTVSVVLALLYIDGSYHRSMLQDDFFEIEIGVADSQGRCQLWRAPKGRMTSERPNPGKNQVVQQNLSFSCEAGGDGFVGGAGNGRMVEVLTFYQRAA